MIKECVKENCLVKLEKEYLQFKKEMILFSKGDIFVNVYRIYIMSTIYEILVTMVYGMEKSKMELLLETNQVLDFMYERWLKIEDDFESQICESVRQTLQNEILQ